MKVGDLEDVVAQLRHDVCINGCRAYVLTCGCEFDEVIRRLAADVECGNSVLHWIDRHQIPQENIDIYEIAIARKAKELCERIFEATAENWYEHRNELYVVCGDGPTKGAVVKAGTYDVVKSMLLQNVCLDDGKAYVLTSKKVFEYLLRDMAAECASDRYSLWQYERGCIPKRYLAEFCTNMAQAHRFISDRIAIVAEDEIAEHGGEVYVIMRDMQLAIDTFAEMSNECSGDFSAAVDRFNDCYNARRFFNATRDAPQFRNAEKLEDALQKPICLIGKDDGTSSPRFAFISLVLAYLWRKSDDELNAAFFRRAMREGDPRFTIAKMILYWYFHEYCCLGGALKRFPAIKSCGLSRKLFKEHGLELSRTRAAFLIKENSKEKK